LRMQILDYFCWQIKKQATLSVSIQSVGSPAKRGAQHLFHAGERTTSA
jgi:hypothetical protein